MTETAPHGPIVSLWLPLAVIRRSGTVHGITRLQKLVFLASIEGHIGDYLGFTEYKFGPWSQVLQNMAQNLTQWGQLECETEELPEPYSPRQNYSLTNEGVKLLKELEDGFEFLGPMNAKLEVLERYETMETPELRNYVYRTYLPHKLDDEPAYEERLRFVISEAESYIEVWNSFEEEHYPISYFILAVLEHILKIVHSLDEHKSTLEHNIVLTSCAFLLRTIWRLLDKLETIRIESPQECDEVRILKGEVEDILTFTDLEASKDLGITPFDKITLSDLALINDT